MAASSIFTRGGVVVLAILSLVYVVAELVFNVRLLDVMAAATVSPVAARDVEYFGRIVSGLGFTLLVLGVFQPWGFRIIGVGRWRIFGVIAFVCLLPFLLSFGQIFFGIFNGSGGADDIDYMAELFWAFVPFVGLGIVALSGGKRPVLVALGLMVLAWPAMFYGQVMAVERMVVANTSADDRRDAQYILLLKSGMADCLVPLQGQRLCDDVMGGNAETRATRAVMGTLFMLNPKDTFASLGGKRDQIIGGVAASGVLFPPQEYYNQYIGKLSAQREQAVRVLHDNYYRPYRQASDGYFEATNPHKAAALAADAATKIENAQFAAEQRYMAIVEKIEQAVSTGLVWQKEAPAIAEKEIDAAWEKYQKGVADYYRLVQTLLQGEIAKLGVEGSAVLDYCTGESCLDAARDKYATLCRKHGCAVDADTVIRRLRQMAADNFYESTGYPHDVKSRDAFVRQPRTQKLIREEVQKNIRVALNDRDYRLPEDWSYDAAIFPAFIKNLQEESLRKAVGVEMSSVFGNEAALPQGWAYDRADFDAMVRPLMDARLRKGVVETIRTAMGDPMFALPDNWSYTREGFTAALSRWISERATVLWDERMFATLKSDIPPGLDEADFYARAGIAPVPPLKDIAMSLPDFVQRYIVPMSEKVADQAIEKINANMPLYANGQKLSGEGKGYVRALYVPAVALVLSLMIVVLTLCKVLVQLSAMAVEKNVRLTPVQHRALRPVLAAFFLLLVVMLPYLWPNAAVKSDAYRYYQQLARAEAPVSARLLDWVVRVQPVVYRAGRVFVRQSKPVSPAVTTP